MSENDQNTVNVIKVGFELDNESLTKLTNEVNEKFASSLAAGLSKSLKKAIGDFGKELGSSIKVAFDDSILKSLTSPIKIKLDTDDAQAKIDKLVKPFQNIVAAADTITNNNNKTTAQETKQKTADEKKQNTADAQKSQLQNVQTEFGSAQAKLNTTGSIGSAQREAIQKQLDEIEAKYKEIAKIQISPTKLLSGDQESVLSKNLTDLKNITTQIEKIHQLTESVGEFKLGSRQQLNDVEKDIFEIAKLITQVGNDEVYTATQTKTLFSQLAKLRSLDTEIKLLDPTKVEEADGLIHQFRGLLQNLHAEYITLGQEDFISPKVIKDVVSLQQEEKKEKETLEARLQTEKEAKTALDGMDSELTKYRTQLTDTLDVIKNFGLDEKNSQTLTKDLTSSIDKIRDAYSLLRVELEKDEPNLANITKAFKALSDQESKFQTNKTTLTSNANGILTNALDIQSQKNAANPTRKFTLDELIPGGISKAKADIDKYEQALDSARKKIADLGIPYADVAKKTSSFESALNNSRVALTRLGEQLTSREISVDEANNKFKQINETLAKTRIAIDQVQSDKGQDNFLKQFNVNELDKFNKGLVTNLAVLGFTLQRVGRQVETFGQTVLGTYKQLATASEPIERAENIIYENFVKTGKITQEQADLTLNSLKKVADFPGNNLKDTTDRFLRLADALGNTSDALKLTEGLGRLTANVGVDKGNEIEQLLLTARNKPKEFTDKSFGSLETDGGENVKKILVNAGINNAKQAISYGADNIIKLLADGLAKLDDPLLTTSDKFNILYNRVAELGKIIGTILSPALDSLNKLLINSILPTLQDIEKAFKSLPDGTKNFISYLVLGIPVIALIGGAIITLGGALAFVGSGFLQLQKFSTLFKEKFGITVAAEEATNAITTLNNATSGSTSAINPNLLARLANKKAGIANPNINSIITDSSQVIDTSTSIKSVEGLKSELQSLKLTQEGLLDKSTSLKNFLDIYKNLGDTSAISKTTQEIVKTESSLSRLTSRINNVTEAIDIARDTSFVGKGLSSLDTYSSSIKGFFSSMGDGVSELKSIPATIGDTFKGIIPTIKSAFGAVTDFTGGITATVDEFGLFKSILGGTVGSVTAITEGFTSLGGTLLEVLGFTNPIGIAINVIISLFTALYSNIDGIRDRLVVNFENLNAAINRVLALLGLDQGGLLGVLGYIGDAFNAIFGSIGVLIIDFINALTGSLAAIINDFVNIYNFFNNGEIINGFKAIGQLLYDSVFGFIVRLAKEFVISIGDAIASLIEKIPGGGFIAARIREATNELGKSLGFDKQAVDANKLKTAEQEKQKKLIEQANVSLEQQKDIIKNISNVINKINEGFAKITTNKALRDAQEKAVTTNKSIDDSLTDKIKAGAISSPDEIREAVAKGSDAELAASRLAFEEKKKEITRQAEELYKVDAFVISKEGTDPNIIRAFQQNISNTIGVIRNGRFNVGELKKYTDIATDFQTQFANSINKDTPDGKEKYNNYLQYLKSFQDLTTQTSSLLDEQDKDEHRIGVDRDKRTQDFIKQYEDVNKKVAAIIATTPLKKQLESLNDQIERQKSIVDDFTSQGFVLESETAQTRLNALKQQQVDLEEKIKESLRSDKDKVRNTQEAQDATIAKAKTKNEIARQHLDIIEKIADQNSKIFQTGIDGLSDFITKLQSINTLTPNITNNLAKGLENLINEVNSTDEGLTQFENLRIISQIQNAQSETRNASKDILTKSEVSNAPTYDSSNTLQLIQPKEALGFIAPKDQGNIKEVAKQVDDLIAKLSNGSKDFTTSALNLGKEVTSEIQRIANLVTASDEKITNLKSLRNNATTDQERNKYNNELNTEIERRGQLLQIGKFLSNEESVINKTIAQRIKILSDEANQRQKILDQSIQQIKNQITLIDLDAQLQSQIIANQQSSLKNPILLSSGNIDFAGADAAKKQATEDRIKQLDKEYEVQKLTLEAQIRNLEIDLVARGATQSEIDSQITPLKQQLELLNKIRIAKTTGLKNDADLEKLNNVKNILSDLTNYFSSGQNIIDSFFLNFSKALDGIGGKMTGFQKTMAVFKELGKTAIIAFGQALGQAVTDSLVNGGNFLKSLGKFFGDMLISIGGQLVALGTAALAFAALAIFFPGIVPPQYAIGTPAAVGAIAAGVGLIVAGKAIGGGGAASTSNSNATNSANASAGNTGQVTYDPLKDPKFIYQQALQKQVYIEVRTDDTNLVKKFITTVNRDPRLGNLVGNNRTGFAL